jgi:type IV pilus assembly protein PilW
VNGDTNPGIRGYDNSVITNAATPLVGLAHGSRDGACAVPDTSCRNGSDILLVRYWGDNRDGAATGDGSMINCAGMNEPDAPTPAYSIFHVVRSAGGEPTLACTYRDPGTLAWATVPLVGGVEGLQLLYGVDNVTANAAPPTGDTGTDSVPEEYLRASELDVPGDAAATADNWRRVRSVRVGLLVRGGENSAVDRASSGRTFAVLGEGFSIAGDVGSDLKVAADGRLRQSLVFTVHMRNPQFVVPANWN